MKAADNRNVGPGSPLYSIELRLETSHLDVHSLPTAVN